MRPAPASASPVAKALRSEHAKAKDASKTADDGSPLHSFRTLLQDLATLAYNITHTHLNPKAKIVTTTRPTPLQAKAFKLLGLNPACLAQHRRAVDEQRRQSAGVQEQHLSPAREAPARARPISPAMVLPV